MISTNLNGFSLANQGRFVKFANVSPCQSFPPYDICIYAKQNMQEDEANKTQWLSDYSYIDAYACD